jgi:hypothetical protein
VCTPSANSQTVSGRGRPRRHRHPKQPPRLFPRPEQPPRLLPRPVSRRSLCRLLRSALRAPRHRLPSRHSPLRTSRPGLAAGSSPPLPARPRAVDVKRTPRREAFLGRKGPPVNHRHRRSRDPDPPGRQRTRRPRSDSRRPSTRGDDRVYRRCRMRMPNRHPHPRRPRTPARATALGRTGSRTRPICHRPRSRPPPRGISPRPIGALLPALSNPTGASSRPRRASPRLSSRSPGPNPQRLRRRPTRRRALRRPRRSSRNRRPHPRPRPAHSRRPHPRSGPVHSRKPRRQPRASRSRSRRSRVRRWNRPSRRPSRATFAATTARPSTPMMPP